MKSYALAASILVLVAASAAFASTASAETYASNLNVVLTNQTPYPVEPGANLDISIQLQNTGRDAAQSVYLEISPTDPFELLPGQEVTKFFSNVPGLDSVKTSYKMHVKSSAITGVYDLNFRIYLGSTQSSFITKKISVNVQGTPDLVVDSIVTSPSSVEPGSISKITAFIKNVGTGSARNSQFQFNSSSEEIKPVLSKGTVFVGNIIPGDTTAVEFEISVDSSAEEKTYTSSITASYKNENNNAVTETFSIGLPVRGTVTLDIVKVEALSDRDTLRIELANKGTTSAKSIEASLMLNNKTIDVDYVSELKATKKTTMDFSPLVTSGVAQLVINYMGPGLEKNQATKEISLNIQGSGSGDGLGITIVVLIVVVVVGYYFWSRHRKKKKHSQ